MKKYKLDLTETELIIVADSLVALEHYANYETRFGMEKSTKRSFDSLYKKVEKMMEELEK